MNQAGRLPRVLVNAVRVLAMIGFLTLALTKELDTTFIGVFLCFFFLSWPVDRYKDLVQYIAIAQPYLAVVMFIVAVLDFLFVSNAFLLSVAHFLLCLQGVRLLSMRTIRDVIGGVLLTSMMMISASTLAVEWTFFAGLCLFLPAVIWTLIMSNIALQGQIVESSKRALSDKARRNTEAGLSETDFVDEAHASWSGVDRP